MKPRSSRRSSSSMPPRVGLPACVGRNASPTPTRRITASTEKPALASGWARNSRSAPARRRWRRSERRRPRNLSGWRVGEMSMRGGEARGRRHSRHQNLRLARSLGHAAASAMIRAPIACWPLTAFRSIPCEDASPVVCSQESGSMTCW
jgi:hypothetical protein